MLAQVYLCRLFPHALVSCSCGPDCAGGDTCKGGEAECSPTKQSTKCGGKQIVVHGLLQSI